MPIEPGLRVALLKKIHDSAIDLALIAENNPALAEAIVRDLAVAIQTLAQRIGELAGPKTSAGGAAASLWMRADRLANHENPLDRRAYAAKIPRDRPGNKRPTQNGQENQA